MVQVLSPRELMDRLVSFPTISRDSNLPLIDFVADYLAGHGITAARVPDPTGEKAALYAHVGPNVEGAVVLSGHTDVVPVDGQAWDTDPFVVTEKDGKLYGRGTCDMKGFDAMAIWAMVEGHRRGLQSPLQLALTYDEEIGCTGAPPLIEAMVASGFARGNRAIIGEPSMMRVVTGHKGGNGLQVKIRGFEVHSSLLHEGVCAIMFAAKLINWCNEMNAANAAAIKPEADGFVPPFTTLHVGMIQGGIANNVTAKDCRFMVSMRTLPSESIADWNVLFMAKVAELEAEMQAIHAGTGIDVAPGVVVPPLQPETAGAAEELVRQLTGDNSTNMVSYGTEAGHFQAAAYSSVICGPGDIAQAHQPNEFVSVKQFLEGQTFMERLLDHLT